MRDDPLQALWACLNCNSTFKCGEMYPGKLASDPLECPRCRSGNTSPADKQSRSTPEYHGEIGTRH